MRKIWLFLFLLIILTSCESEESVLTIDPVNASFTFEHNGINRTYDLYIPENTKVGAPLMLMLHGFTSDKETIRRISNMDALAMKHGFAVVYPQGEKSSYSFFGQRIEENHWNAGLLLSDIDDVNFLVELTKYLQETFELSSEQTFVSGFSNGGFMAYTLACEASEVFKGIGVVSGMMSGRTYETCDPSHPVDIIHIHGTNDRVVPHDGTMFAPGGWGGAPEVSTMLEKWYALNNIEVKETNTYETLVTEIKAYGDTQPSRVYHYLLDNWFHEWPVSPNPNELGLDPKLDASETIVSFLLDINTD